jgi:glycosyltransferase involved in cell wall biosynthesis
LPRDRPVLGTALKTSVISCFYGRPDFLEACLDSLRGARGDIHEVVVADDGSGEETVARVRALTRRYDFPVVHAWHPREGPRRAATRNNGIRHASGDYLVFLDADFAVLPGAVRSHVAAARPGFFAAGRCKYTTEAQARRILAEGASESLLESIYRELPEEPVEKEHRRFVRHALLRRLGLSGPRRLTFGGHFSAFRSDVEAVNGYDENYVEWGGEDQDLALRMVLAGFRGTSVIRTARVLHLWHSREMGAKHWKEGPNTGYFLRGDVRVFCENGLTKGGRDR